MEAVASDPVVEVTVLQAAADRWCCRLRVAAVTLVYWSSCRPGCPAGGNKERSVMLGISVQGGCMGGPFYRIEEGGGRTPLTGDDELLRW